MSIRVFIGCAANHEDIESQAVVEWSIKKYASEPVEITWMKQSNDPQSLWSGWNTSNWVTPFSGFRWAIPHACGFKGRAIYCDSDVIYMADIAQLWNQPMKLENNSILAKGGSSWRLCVSLWDCERAASWVIPIHELKENSVSHSIMSRKVLKPGLIRAFRGNWNCLDGEKYTNLRDPEIKAIHYTAIANQPQLRYAIPRLQKTGLTHWYDGKIERHWREDLIELFDEMLSEAKENGYPPERYAQDPPFGSYKNRRSLKTYRPGPRA